MNMSYVDGFVLAVPEDRMADYQAMAEIAAKIWKKHGALSYRECVIDDDHIEGTRSFAETSGASKGEVTVFAYIRYESKAHRDAVNAKVMADPDLKCDPENMPFDCAKMSYGGFKTLVGGIERMTAIPDMNQSPSFTLNIERVLQAPRERVWRAWTDKEYIRQWLSPLGFHVRSYNGTIATGEAYREHMVGPEGQDSIFFGEFLELIPPEKLVFSHTWHNDTCGIPGIRTLCTVLLEAIDENTTRMTFTQSGISTADSRDSQNGGWGQCFDKLALMVD
jgi:uncharacterized protein YbaA (DUF1428 family)/uncharacterized protein YndB with AHSA1/START domain